jgi:hypothetical protein
MDDSCKQGRRGTPIRFRLDEEGDEMAAAVTRPQRRAASAEPHSAVILDFGAFKAKWQAARDGRME